MVTEEIKSILKTLWKTIPTPLPAKPTEQQIHDFNGLIGDSCDLMVELADALGFDISEELEAEENAENT